MTIIEEKRSEGGRKVLNIDNNIIELKATDRQ